MKFTKDEINQILDKDSSSYAARVIIALLIKKAFPVRKARNPLAPLIQAARKGIANGRLIPAIKDVRELTRDNPALLEAVRSAGWAPSCVTYDGPDGKRFCVMGLADAKHFVEAVRDGFLK